LAQNLHRQNWSDPPGLEGPTIVIATVVYQFPFYRGFLDALRQSTPWQPRGGSPIVILGPGEAEMAHQTDEYCRVDRIVEANSLFKDLIKDWNGTA
jgi:succinyl-diaminopimelate desuccinylase